MKKTLIVVGIIVLLVIVGLILSNRNVSAPSSEILSQETNQPAAGGVSPSSTTEMAQPTVATITFTDAGYAPASLVINKGTTVTFKNTSNTDTWPASAMHPSHTVYDGTSLREHCANPTSTTFDACGGIKPRESWVFTFTKVGTWGYHDHLSPSFFGKIIVQ